MPAVAALAIAAGEGIPGLTSQICEKQGRRVREGKMTAYRPPGSLLPPPPSLPCRTYQLPSTHPNIVIPSSCSEPPVLAASYIDGCVDPCAGSCRGSSRTSLANERLVRIESGG